MFEMIRNMNSYPLYDDGEHKVYWLGIEEAEDEKGILTNQYLVIDGKEAALIEPGGFFVFSRVLKNVSSLVPPTQIKYLMYSHQDPDVIAGLNLWFEYAPLAKVVISNLWVRFLPHLAVLSAGRAIGIPDKGTDFKIGNSVIKASQATTSTVPETSVSTMRRAGSSSARTSGRRRSLRGSGISSSRTSRTM